MHDENADGPAPDGWDDGWVADEEHGHNRESWILDQDGYGHPDYPGRDSDGRFKRRLGSKSDLDRD